MNRRNFIKNTLLTAAALASGRAAAEEHIQENEGKEKKLRRLSDPAHPTALEQKHVPLIEAPARVKPGEWFDVRVKVGFMKEHPSVPEHWITMMKLLLDGEKVANTEFTSGGISSSSAVFRIKLSRTASLEAVENCNLHGTWISSPVSVTVS